MDFINHWKYNHWQMMRVFALELDGNVFCIWQFNMQSGNACLNLHSPECLHFSASSPPCVCCFMWLNSNIHSGLDSSVLCIIFTFSVKTKFAVFCLVHFYIGGLN